MIRGIVCPLFSSYLTGRRYGISLPNLIGTVIRKEGVMNPPFAFIVRA